MDVPLRCALCDTEISVPHKCLECGENYCENCGPDPEDPEGPCIPCGDPQLAAEINPGWAAERAADAADYMLPRNVYTGESKIMESKDSKINTIAEQMPEDPNAPMGDYGEPDGYEDGYEGEVFDSGIPGLDEKAFEMGRWQGEYGPVPWIYANIYDVVKKYPENKYIRDWEGGFTARQEANYEASLSEPPPTAAERDREAHQAKYGPRGSHV